MQFLIPGGKCQPGGSIQLSQADHRHFVFDFYSCDIRRSRGKERNMGEGNFSFHICCSPFVELMYLCMHIEFKLQDGALRSRSQSALGNDQGLRRSGLSTCYWL